jgi:hypothetical protein
MSQSIDESAEKVKANGRSIETQEAFPATEAHKRLVGSVIAARHRSGSAFVFPGMMQGADKYIPGKVCPQKHLAPYWADGDQACIHCDPRGHSSDEINSYYRAASTVWNSAKPGEKPILPPFPLPRDWSAATAPPRPTAKNAGASPGRNLEAPAAAAKPKLRKFNLRPETHAALPEPLRSAPGSHIAAEIDESPVYVAWCQTEQAWTLHRTKKRDCAGCHREREARRYRGQREAGYDTLLADALKLPRDRRKSMAMELEKDAAAEGAAMNYAIAVGKKDKAEGRKGPTRNQWSRFRQKRKNGLN